MADSGPGTEKDKEADSGSKDRATVALVDAKVDGLRELIRAEFANVKYDVRALASVVSDVIKQGVQIDDHERRLSKLEKDIEDESVTDREFRRFHRPSLIIAAVAVVVAVAALITQLSH